MSTLCRLVHIAKQSDSSQVKRKGFFRFQMDISSIHISSQSSRRCHAIAAAAIY